MSTGLYIHTTRATGTVLTAAIYNSDHQKHITNANPLMTGAYGDDLTQFKLNSDPGEVGTEILPGSLAIELEYLRFCIKRITGEAEWYIAPDVDLGNIPGREVLTADRTYYVNPTGDNANTGLAVDTPFEAIQYAWDVICKTLDLNGFNVIIQLADGTHTTGFNNYANDGTADGYVGGGIVVLQGNAASPQNVIVDSNGFTIWIVSGYLKIEHFEVRASTGDSCLAAAWSGVIEIGDGMRFGTSAAEHIHASSGGQVRVIGDYSIVGDAVEQHMSASQGGQVRIGGFTITLTGTPAFEVFAAATDGIVDARDATFSGAATGKRFELGLGGIILTETGDTGFFPGNADGTFEVGSRYDEITGPLSEVIASGSFPAANALNITNIPVWAKKLTINIVGLSSNTASRFPRVQLSIDGGASYATEDYSVNGLNNVPAVLGGDAGIVDMFTAVAAARAWNITATILGLAYGDYPTTFFTGITDDFSAAVIGGQGAYIGSTDFVNAIRIILNDTGNIDAGTYTVIASP